MDKEKMAARKLQLPGDQRLSVILRGILKAFSILFLFF